MYYIYVLKSLKTGKRYIGTTHKDPKDRLFEHNQGKTPFTKNNRPFKLIYYEKGYCVSCARKRELFLKTGKGRYFLDILEKNLCRNS